MRLHFKTHDLWNKKHAKLHFKILQVMLVHMETSICDVFELLQLLIYR